jgi:hypothetical protein
MLHHRKPDARSADLMVGAPTRQQFWVDVKGVASEVPWLLKPKPEQQNLFYILVSLAPLAAASTQRLPDRFLILSQKQANDLVENYRREHPKNRGTMPGFNWKDGQVYEDAWKILPN